MRWTHTLIPTLKETPQEAQIISHRLMLRAGMIRKLASGVYSYLPIGLRSLQKAQEIVRQEMNAVGAIELLLPALHPAELWKETGRYELLGEDMVHFKDRHGKANVLGPTHEEVITDLVRREVQSYKQLPITLYQIQTKFRDEMRPRSGIIRSREFIMKDAYSFHTSFECLDETYQKMRHAYERVFSRAGLEFYVVAADPGAMGGSGSQEFVLFSEAGEDRMVLFEGTTTVMSVDMAARDFDALKKPAQGVYEQESVHTPHQSSVESVAQYLKVPVSSLIKTMIYQVPSQAPGSERLVAVLVRGDHEVSAYKINQVEKGAFLASRDQIENKLGSAFGYSGPIGLKSDALAAVYVDADVLDASDAVVGDNKADYHRIHVNAKDILSSFSSDKLVVGDYRQLYPGDRGVLGGQRYELMFKTAIELGHIFKLNLRYSEPMKATYLGADGKQAPVIMGCYGIGVNRILAAAIEQCADKDGIVWPKNIAPYQVHVVLVDEKNEEALRITTNIENSRQLAAKGIDVLVDDRSAAAGVKFKDADLIGCPLRITLGPKGLKDSKAEIKLRKTGQVYLVSIEEIEAKTIELLDNIN